MAITKKYQTSTKLHQLVTEQPNKGKKYTNDHRSAMGIPKLDLANIPVMKSGTATMDCPGCVDKKPGTTTTASGEIAARKHDMTECRNPGWTKWKMDNLQSCSHNDAFSSSSHCRWLAKSAMMTNFGRIGQVPIGTGMTCPKYLMASITPSRLFPPLLFPKLEQI